MRTDELKQHIEETGESAFEILSDALPKVSAKFYRLEKSMAKLLDEVREHFPEAIFYTSGGDGFALSLGDTHSGRGWQPNNELVAVFATKLHVAGGDW
ncbi:hypothetical protein BS639_17045 [Rouxiella silvae]|uniref:Uncharacterized protein n=1 Tax=Rouxiella silvae TaxID=1646373 RepID=A0ABX3TXM7_9GAMM|nr:hypothetical protein [Rouxiella silvae]ORJ20001.1 hypothetical protein BS639_17045 [Rouxiella silvae]